MSLTPTATGPTAELGAFVANLRFSDLPPSVVAAAQNVILDAFGGAIGAWTDDRPKAEIMCALAGTFRAAPVATVWGSQGVRTDAAVAALANGALVNAADFDDTHRCAVAYRIGRHARLPGADRSPRWATSVCRR